MALNEILSQMFEKGSVPPPALKKVWVEESDRINVHAKGIRPKFRNPRTSAKTGRSNGWIVPANYEARYQYVFDNFILNRHPNEVEEHYHWRLATFAIISNEVYLKICQQILGSIFQNNQYTVNIVNDKLKSWSDYVGFNKMLCEFLPDFLFREHGGIIAIVEGHNEEFTSEETAIPKVLFIEPKDIIHYTSEEVFFSYGDYYYYITKTEVSKLEVDLKQKYYKTLVSYTHDFGELPVFQNTSQFFKPFTTWADLIARNLSDDEVIAKNASYPHKQVVEPTCKTCAGHGSVEVECETGMCTEKCSTCEGKGTMSINPGEVYVIPEREPNDLRPMPEMVKFINPDIAVNEFSLKRWQLMYDKGMAAMHCKLIDSAQSGEAKAKDRENFYFLVSSISNYIFDCADWILRIGSKYLNIENVNGRIMHVESYDKLQRPQQFAIKTEYDLQNEYLQLTEKNAEISVRREKLDHFVEKAFNGNGLSKKRHEMKKLFDWLYGMTDAELTTRKLLGTAQTKDFIKHDMADYVMNVIIEDKGEEWFIKTPSKTVLELMNTTVSPFIPEIMMP